jgi:hypothetical protein
MQVHHRLPRRLGGRGPKGPDVNSPANLCVLCPSCHEHVESHREEAYTTGYLVREGQDPAKVPVLFASGVWWLLRHDGKLEQPGSRVRSYSRKGMFTEQRIVAERSDRTGGAA